MIRKGILMVFKALGAGERWITVRAPGHEKGQPVLIQQQPDGSSKVIGGAGGSLNHLRLTGVKPQSAYKEAIKARAKDRADIRKQQREQDKKLGIQKAKADAHRKVTEQKKSAAREFVKGVAQTLGWAPEDYNFNEAMAAGQPDHVAAKMRDAHERELVKKALAAVKINRERILADAEARAEVDLGEVPLSSESPEVLSVQDLDPVKAESLGLGYSTNYKERAEKAGLTEDAAAAEAEEFKAPKTDAQRKAAIASGETGRMVRESMALLRQPDQVDKLAPKLVEARKALDLLKMEKKLKLAERQASAARKEIDQAVTEPKAYVLEVDSAKVDADVSESIANDLRTIRTRAFLAEVGKTAKDPAEALGRHIGVGAYNSINALALAAGGAALVDRSVVDVLGIAGAAEVLARRLRHDLAPEEFGQVAEGMEDFHLNHYMEASKEAMARAKELQDQASEMELGEAENGADLATMQEINARRAEAIGESQKVLGQALGEMEANAALVYALKGGSEKPFEVSLGKVALEDAIRQVRAIGLQRGDYSIETAAGNRVLTVKPGGLDRLAAPVNRADLEQVRRNLDIIEGKHDEDGWLPLGVTDRPDLDLKPKPGVAQRLAVPFTPADDLAASVADYIGGRAADGDPPADILSDLQSAEFIRQVGFDRSEEYRDVLDRLAPLQGDDGKLRPAESLQPAFDKMADEFVAKHYGEKASPLQRQKFAVDDHSIEALHRALAAEPAGVAAYKPIGEMTPQDQGALREFFAANVAKESPEAAAHRHDLEAAEKAEPERTVQDMFGDTVTNPEWQSWRAKRDDLRAKVNSASITWTKYVEAMHGPEHAYSAVQDLIRSRVSKGFADAMNQTNPKSPIKVGRTVIRNYLNHLDSVDPAKREERLAKERALTDHLRNRTAGRYASGSVRDKLDSARQVEAGFDAAQMGFFADDAPAEDRHLEADQRYTVGHEAERQIAALMPKVGENFKPGQPVKLFRPSMSGGKNWARQRAVKMIEANKRVVLSFGTGGGKTLITLGGFTNLQQQGKAKRGLFLVPSIVQGEFGAEALRFLKPGTFKWNANPGASRNQRIAAYKDPESHFGVFTHQAFRDDMIHLAAGHANIPEDEMGRRVAAMSQAERKDWMRGVMRREGINYDYVAVDEGHNTLNRQGKENSEMANVIDSVTDNSNYFVTASADPVKNDVSEAFSLLQKMDPERYTDQAAFMRKYGVDSIAAKDELRREMARFQYPSKIDPDITATRIERKVPVSDEQKSALSALDGALSRARIARMSGKVDVGAMKEISPGSFASAPDDQHEAIARELQANIGILKDAAIRRVLNGGAKIDEVAKVAAEKSGKPGVVFAHSIENVEAISKRLRDEGHRVVTITGKDSAKAKAAKKRAFNPDAGDATADILVASDAGSTGLNAQRGHYVVNVDTPMTAMTHAQRNGRINRIGQKNNVDLIDLVADHPEEKKNRDRLENKYALRDAMTTPMESLDDTGLAHFLRQRQIAKENGGFI